MLHCPKCKSQITNENINIQTDVAQCVNCTYLFNISENIDNTEKITSTTLPQPPIGAWYENNGQSIRFGATTKGFVALFLIPFMLFWSHGVFSKEIFTLDTNFLGLLFLLIGGLFWWTALMLIIGKVEITTNRQGGKIFVGIWKIGRYQSFEWKDINFIQESSTMFMQYPGNRGAHIIMEGNKCYSFGSGLSHERRYYLIQVLKYLHRQYQLGR